MIAHKPVAILNPKAAGGKTAKRWPEIERLLRERLGGLEARFTLRSGHASELARDALQEGSDLIIAVGGDGTINEIVNGFFDHGTPIRPEARLGFIPRGTGSDLQRTLCIPAEPERAVTALCGGATLKVDVGQAELTGHDGSRIQRYFANLVSFGMGGEVAARAKNFLMPLGGKVAFLYATFVVFFGYRGKHVRLTLDDDPEPRDFFITNVAIGNGRYHGGGMHPCPRAQMDDGWLEVTTIDRLGWFELIRDLPVLYSEDVYRHPKVRHFRARRIRAEAEEVTRVEVDGEPLGRLPVEMRLLPKALPIIVPAESPVLRHS